MFRRWLSGFWKKNKAKIYKYLRLCAGVIIVAYIAFAVLNILQNNNFFGSNFTQKDNKQIYKPSETIISGKNIKSEEFEEEKNLVEIFLEYCNNGETENAYNMLSDYCKDELYPNLSYFEDRYYKNIFTEKRMYNIRSWVNDNDYHTYLIRYPNDALSTGVYDRSNVYQDYITICMENGERKINIGNLIKAEDINIASKKNDINIKIIHKTTYMNYSIYKIEVENQTGKTIALDPYENLSSTYIKMSNNLKISIDWKVIDEQKFIIKDGKKKTLECKFNVPYGLNTKPKYLEFDQIVLDYDEYKNIESYQEQKEYDNRTKVSIKLW